ncbi:transporter [Bdellovibrio sp. SKB1291214]|uniref:transporter n=1 Tax=Bdellovibrio sp. SKB1291214 TaxID=1732569 RepID=UPI001C3DF22A|nr:transporter [Bdellovibrio sp. SKB1291214]UYL09910.1 transporter [Bdellovibrio sp. SKB1291214]
MPSITYADGARDWQSIPFDTNLLFIYYTYSNNEVSIDPSLPIDGVSVNANVPIIRYARSFAINGKIGGIQLIVPYGFVDARITGTNMTTSAQGWGDVNTILFANLFGAPALTRAQFVKWTPEDYLTAAVGITAPTGSYHEDSILNIGKNRWSFKPQLSYGTYLSRRTLLAINANVQIFTDNDGYKNRERLSQDLLYGLELHLSRDINNTIWVAGDGFYAYGGETKIDGAHQNNWQRTLRVGLSAGLKIDSATAMSASATRSVLREDYTPSTTTFSINLNRAY